MSGRLIFVGAGPGAADLLTLRAARAIASADIVIWGQGLLLREALDDHLRAGAEVIAWPPATMDDVLRAYDRARDEGLSVVRLKSGDASLFGELADELGAAAERGLAVEFVPGVSAVAAAGAALGSELTAGAGLTLRRTEAGDGPRSVALFMPGRDPDAAQAALLAEGLAEGDPCAIVHRVSWPGEMLVRCRVGEVAEHLSDLGLDGMTLLVAGPAVP